MANVVRAKNYLEIPCVLQAAWATGADGAWGKRCSFPTNTGAAGRGDARFGFGRSRVPREVVEGQADKVRGRQHAVVAAQLLNHHGH